MTSVERLVAYTTLPSEAAPRSAPGLLPPDWPSAGKVEFISLTIRYSPSLPPVLNGVTFCVAAGQKLGAVGRTGAGKSTLVSALFRLVENSGCSGRILIDGIDIARVGLDDLRTALSLIPQEPVLFTGDLASNLDPFGTAPPGAAEAIIPRLGLSARAGAQGGAAEVAEGGENWSVGERQLVCLGRALLRRSRLLVCDEPTANLDAEADRQMQEAIRTDFASSTVIVVAHRLSSIMAADAVAVLAPGGKLVEHGEPALLLDASGAFAELVDAAGSAHSAQLRATARDAQQQRRLRGGAEKTTSRSHIIGRQPAESAVRRPAEHHKTENEQH